MNDPFDGYLRYLVHYSDGGSGMRRHPQRLDAGAEFSDGGARYRITRVDQPPNERGFGHVWAERI